MTKKTTKVDSHLDTSLQKGIDTSLYHKINEKLETLKGKSYETIYQPGRIDTVHTYTTEKGETKYITVQAQPLFINRGTDFDYSSQIKEDSLNKQGIDTTNKQAIIDNSEKKTNFSLGFNSFQIGCLAVIALSIVFLVIVHLKTNSKVVLVTKTVNTLAGKIDEIMNKLNNQN